MTAPHVCSASLHPCPPTWYMTAPHAQSPTRVYKCPQAAPNLPSPLSAHPPAYMTAPQARSMLRRLQPRSSTEAGLMDSFSAPRPSRLPVNCARRQDAEAGLGAGRGFRRQEV